jgi:MFS family permease
MSTTDTPSMSPANAKRLLFAGFAAILAAGVGFGVRGGIFANWGADFGFTGLELGKIGGAGFTGFCFGIIIAGVVVDKIGYGKMVAAAFLLHMVSAFVTFGATPAAADATEAVKAAASASAYSYLFWGMFLFALGNGVLEGVANPLVSTLFPQNRTHYLNILHASWPAGLVLGGLVGWTMGAHSMIGGDAGLSWKIQLAMYLIPTLVYGVLFFGQTFPKSEAAAKGLPVGEMFKDVGLLGGLVVCALLAMFFSGMFAPLLTPKDATPEQAMSAAATAKYIGWGIGFALLTVVGVLTKFSIGSILLFVLFITHALVGSVELGTDGWIQNITGNFLTPAQGKLLFIFTSLVMFSLRFCAHFIESKLKISPIGLLLICAVLAVIGLNLASNIDSFGMAMVALTVYALGKTFFWPTMLAVIGDRFPRSGAIAMSIMGGIGMMSAGLIGGPGLGYAKDRFAAEALKATSAETYEASKSAKPSEFLIFADVNAIDGSKLGAAQKSVGDYAAEQKKITAGEKIEKPLAEPSASDKAIAASSIAGDRKTLVADSAIPAAMALIYLSLLLWFKTIGGYKPVRIEEEALKA